MDALLKAQQAAKQPVIYCDPNELQGFIFGVYETITVGKKSDTRTFALYSEAPEIEQNRLLIEPAMLEKLGYVPKSAVLDEREACARVCEVQEETGGEWDIQQKCANAIRARGNDAVGS